MSTRSRYIVLKLLQGTSKYCEIRVRNIYLLPEGKASPETGPCPWIAADTRSYYKIEARILVL